MKLKYGQTSEEDEVMKIRTSGEVSTTIGQKNSSNDLNTGLTNGLTEVPKPGLAQLSESGSAGVQDDVVVEEEEEKTGEMDIVDLSQQFKRNESVLEKKANEAKSTKERTNVDMEAKALVGQLCEGILGDAIAANQPGEKEETKCGLRFLPNMVVMVKDSATVDETSG